MRKDPAEQIASEAVTPARRWLEPAVAVIVAALILGYGLGSAWIASGYVDPIAKYGTQDESIYGSSALRMAEGGDWLTPVYARRIVLNKPPVVYWTGAIAVKLFGISSFALRLPSFLAGVAVCLLVFCWTRRTRPFGVALAAMLLVAMNPTFHFMSRRLMTDALLTGWFTGAAFVLYGDPRLEKRGSVAGLGLLAAAAVMTKSIAGFLPLAVLGVYWLAGDKRWRPRLARVAATGMVTLATAAGWHLYQYFAHREWFLAEYVEAQILLAGSSVPWKEAVPAQLAFYAERIFRTDPLLSVLFVAGLVFMWVRWRRDQRGSDPVTARLLLAWFAVMAAALVVFRHQSLHYMMPAIPVMAMVAARDNPLLAGRRVWIAVAVLSAVFVLKAKETEAVWRLDYAPGSTLAVAPQINEHCRALRDNELVMVSPADEFYSSILGFPFVRYVLFASVVDPVNTPRFAWHLGLMMTAGQLLDESKWRPVYRERLAAWGLSDDTAMATVIVVDDEEQLLELIQASPSRDFLLPDVHRELVTAAELPDHQQRASESGHFFLLSRHGGGRPGPPSPLCMVDAGE